MKKRAFVRRLLALATAAVMLLSAVPAMAAFRDTAGHWAEKTLAEWQEQGLINGYSDGGFHPNASVTRAEFVKLLNRALNFTAESAISFTDVKESDWFYVEVAKAAAAGYAQGSNGAFRPEQAITRAEAAAMIARAVNLTADEKHADAFKDAAAIPAWAKGSVGAVAESGYMNGYPDGTFGAGNYITRAEAVVTLDRMRKDVQSVTVEKAGTTLENETVAGNLIIAASVGEGNVTLKNMTIRGDLIVRGGGANSIYLDGVEVSGSVRLQKENVHLRLMGDTALDSVVISQPCRITQDGSFKGALGTVVIDLEKDSIKKIQIEVPAERVEVVSRANVALNADVEKLVLSENAEGAQLEIRRSATVGELTADAKAKLTGSGTVSSLVVSASDVTVSGSLSVKKTETTDGAKEPTVSSGSSGSSGRVLKEITGIAPITAEVPYGTSGADALKKLPAEIMLNVKDGSTVQTAAAGWSWADGVTYSGTTAGNYTAATAFTVPSGYTYSGTKTVTAAVTVKALDTSGFDKALKEAQALKNGLTDSEAEAAADPANKIFVTSETNAANITEGVRFTTGAARNALEAAIAAANNAKANFASQQECTNQTEALTAVVKAFRATIKTGKNTTTDAYILQQVNSFLMNDNPNAPFASSKKPLKLNYIYPLPTQYSVGNASIKLSWEGSGEGMSYITLGSELSGVGGTISYGAKVTNAPDTPKEITFTAKITQTDASSKEIGSINYTATIGAPIRTGTVTDTPPKLTSGPFTINNITLFVPLSGASAIDYVVDSRISVNGLSSDAAGTGTASIDSNSKNGDCTLRENGLSLPVTATCGSLELKMRPSSGTPAHVEGKIRVTIPSDALKLKEGSGWYVDGDLTYDAVVWACNPAITITPHSASSGNLTQVRVTVRIEYAERDTYIGTIAFTTSKDTIPSNDNNPIVSVDLDTKYIKTDPQESGQNLLVYDIDNVQLSADTQYYIWCTFERWSEGWQNVGNITTGGKGTP